MVPVNHIQLFERERELLTQCIDTGWISSEGPFVNEFEEKMAAAAGRRYGIAVSNGTAALDIAVKALGIGQGDEVIMPTFTIISCAAQLVRAGAVPVLVDAQADTWNMAVEQIETKITSRTKAIMAVHTYGLPVSMQPLLDMARRYQLRVIEDAAEAIGQTCRDRPCGSFGDISILSFYANKHVTTGEGGMVLTDNTELARRCRSLRNLCFQPHQRFVHEELGWNYRMTNMQAAIGIAQLERLPQVVGIKRRMGERYAGLLQETPGIQQPLMSTPWAHNLFWVYGILLKDDVHLCAQDVTERLNARGIGTRPFFWPLHRQPVFKKRGLFKGQRFPVAEKLARKGFYLPSGVGTTEAQIEEAAIALHEVMSDAV